MGIHHLWDRLTQADPALNWIREQDAPRARRVLVRIAILFLFLIPIFAMQPQAYDSPREQPAMAPVGFFFGFLSFGMAMLLAMNVSRPLVIRRPLLELLGWLALIATVGASTYIWGMGLVGAPAISGTDDPNAQLARFKQFLAGSEIKSALVAWLSAACTSLVMILSIRGNVFRPVPHGVFVAACIALTVVDDPAFEQNRIAIVFMIFVGLLLHAINRERFQRGNQAYLQHCAARDEQSQQNSLISSVIGTEAHERLRRNERVADSFSNLTVLFADMVGFTALSRRISPGHLVDLLNEIFEAGDEIAREHGMEKVKTIGDCYMAVAGGIASPEHGSADAIRFAVRYLEKVEEVSRRLEIPLALRAGIHTGPAVGGIIGVSRPTYDYWGDTVNLASRLEGASGAGRILVSESTWLQTKRDFVFDDGKDIEVKGLGTVHSYFVVQSESGENIIPLIQRTN